MINGCKVDSLQELALDKDEDLSKTRRSCYDMGRECPLGLFSNRATECNAGVKGEGT